VRRIITAALGTISAMVLLLAYPTSHNASVAASGGVGTGTGAAGGTGATGSTATGSTAAKSKATTSTGKKTAATKASGVNGTFTGDAVQTRWGTVQVQITVQNGKITAAQAVQYPNDNGHSQDINNYALPILAQEAVQAQSASIDAVSGATVTSGGYLPSLQSAINAAHL
jgi:uncharacterized protein with FMN-binding domain